MSPEAQVLDLYFQQSYGARYLGRGRLPDVERALATTLGAAPGLRAEAERQLARYMDVPEGRCVATASRRSLLERALQEAGR